jgi:hypothetical protein
MLFLLLQEKATGDAQGEANEKSNCCFVVVFSCLKLRAKVVLFFFFCLTRRTISPKGFITLILLPLIFINPLRKRDVINYLKLERTTLG